MDNTTIDNGEHYARLAEEAERIYPITSNMCAWRKGKMIWLREKWVKEQLAN